MVRTPGSHPGNRGSIPRSGIKTKFINMAPEIMRVDTHFHSINNHEEPTPEHIDLNQSVEKAKEVGLGCLCVSNHVDFKKYSHENLDSYEKTSEAAGKVEDFPVFVGMELSLMGHEYVVYGEKACSYIAGHSEEILKIIQDSKTDVDFLQKVLRKVKIMDGIIIKPHPFGDNDLIDEIGPMLDGIETTRGGQTISKEDGGQIREYAKKYNLKKIHSSDAHDIGGLGSNVTIMPGDISDEKGFRDFFRKESVVDTEGLETSISIEDCQSKIESLLREPDDMQETMKYIETYRKTVMAKNFDERYGLKCDEFVIKQLPTATKIENPIIYDSLEKLLVEIQEDIDHGYHGLPSHFLKDNYPEVMVDVRKNPNSQQLLDLKMNTDPNKWGDKKRVSVTAFPSEAADYGDLVFRFKRSDLEVVDSMGSDWSDDESIGYEAYLNFLNLNKCCEIYCLTPESKVKLLEVAPGLEDKISDRFWASIDEPRMGDWSALAGLSIDVDKYENFGQFIGQMKSEGISMLQNENGVVFLYYDKRDDWQYLDELSQAIGRKFQIIMACQDSMMYEIHKKMGYKENINI